MREKRDEIIILRTTKAEKNRIYEKMLGMGIRSLSAYIRKMALDGYCLNIFQSFWNGVRRDRNYHYQTAYPSVESPAYFSIDKNFFQRADHEEDNPE